MAKIVQLKDRNNLDICPVVAAAATYMEDGVSVEEKLNLIDNKLAATADSILANASEIKDSIKLQSTINAELQAAIDNISTYIPTLTVPDSTAEQVLAPNVLYIFETRTSTLTLTLGTPIDGIANEYHFFIKCGSTAPTINFPAGITWNGENAPEIAADKTYEISILNNIAAYFEV